jgi:pyruvate/2-oxoglutarate dehydrogenase complex dihydrolipoamide dehydrogenase (E3) component
VRDPERYDALVLGSGQGGNPLAKALAAGGRRTALIEREHVGGCCINEGCTPTKTMVASARVAYLAGRGRDYGVRTGAVTVDQTAVRERKRDIVRRWRGSSERSLHETSGLDLFMGEARFVAPRTAEVHGNDGPPRRCVAEWVFINTGARPSRPDIPGLDTVPALDSTTIMELGETPEHLLVLGGGYVGLEFGQMFRRFGSRVTVVQRGPRLLGREDPDIAEAVARLLREDGIDVLLDTAVEAVAPGDGSRGTASSPAGTAVPPGARGVRLTVRRAGPDRPEALIGSHLLVATGRVPNTEALNLQAAGVATDSRGHVRVSERLETTAPGVYALGDVKPGPAFTHISYDDFRVLETNLLKGGRATTAGRLVPYTVFTDPELGRVGLTEREAREAGHEVRVARMPMSSVARAAEAAETRGVMKIVVDAGDGKILGCAILGLWGGELMSMVELAMMGGLPYPALQSAIFAHPTLAESLNNVFDYFED